MHGFLRRTSFIRGTVSERIFRMVAKLMLMPHNRPIRKPPNTPPILSSSTELERHWSGRAQNLRRNASSSVSLAESRGTRLDRTGVEVVDVRAGRVATAYLKVRTVRKASVQPR
jgi:hypothetical protein